MAKSPKRPTEIKDVAKQTLFQVYDSAKGTFDFTEFKLIRLARLSTSLERKLAIRQLLKEYKACEVKIAWNRGEPIYVSVSSSPELQP